MDIRLDFLNNFQFQSNHKTIINSPLSRVYEHTQKLDMSEMPLTRFFMGLREGVAKLSPAFRKKMEEHPMDLKTFCHDVFTPLHFSAEDGIHLGMIGSVWQMDLRLKILPNASIFQKFNNKTYAKILWSFEFETVSENKTVLKTSTRIFCPSSKTAFRFRLYWFFIKPFSGLLRKDMLRDIKKRSEKAQ